MERIIADTWAEVLSQPILDYHSGFFDLGGDSLLATQCASRLKQKLPVELSLMDFYEFGTVSQLALHLAGLLAEKRAVQPEPKLVLVQPGKKQGTVFFLGVGMFRLAQALKEGPAMYTTVVPFFASGSGAAALKKGEPPPSLEQIAREHTKQILPHLDKGPCVLVGHSFTGMVAFEVAHQLSREGRCVDALFLLDTWASEPRWWQKLRQPSVALVRASLTTRTQRLRDRLSNFRRGNTKRRRAYSCEKSETVYPSFDEMPGEVWPHVVVNALKGYRVRPIDSRAVLFRARNSHLAHLYDIDSHLGWRNVFSRGLEIIESTGDHVSILVEPDVSALAVNVQSHLDVVTKR
jgi:thioesterase domain-containing protein/acyl carrier protein